MTETKSKPEIVEGYKFVTREYTDGYNGTVDYSRIGEWIELSESEITRDGKACGKGFHLLRCPVPLYIGRPIGWVAQGRDVLGQDSERMRVRAIRLVRPLRFGEIFHPGANLHGAHLYNADLSGADLSSAHLSHANLSHAHLSYANLSGANLSYADLPYADLSDADLFNANLSYANLSHANLSYANLSHANLYSANLYSANLKGADLKGVKMPVGYEGK